MVYQYEQLTDEQKKALEKHLELVIRFNSIVNLTRIDEREEALLLHIEDSLTGLKELNDSPSGLYGDLGSGGGYPGIPLAIASGRKTVLIDSRMKKMDAMKEIVEELGLSDQISTYAGRAELLARSQAAAFSVLTARALAKVSVLLELASPLLKMGGHLICYKSQVVEEEYENALRIADLVGMKLITDRSFLLGEDYTRRIITFEKTRKSKVKLPRNEGAAQKNPL